VASRLAPIDALAGEVLIVLVLRCHRGWVGSWEPACDDACRYVQRTRGASGLSECPRDAGWQRFGSAGEGTAHEQR